MNETYESIIGQERQIAHPARTSVLHRGLSAQISPRDATKKIVTNDNVSKLQEGELPSRGHGEPPRALLVSPSAMFGTTLVEMLRQINMGCQIIRTPRIAEPFFVNDQELYSLIVIDLDVFPRDGKALIATITARQPGTPIVAFSDDGEQRLTEVTMESNLVIYFTKASPRLLIEGVLRLVISAQTSRPPQNNVRRR